jgi:glycosyltransferase involved in cell wall biosynthesis
MLDKITPIILTWNEAPNIGRTLDQVRWAGDIVIVDSFSDDDTLKIVSNFPQARVFQRKFDSHDRQWNFGLNETGITSQWVMALDADFIVSDELITEINRLQPTEETKGYRAPVVFRVRGRELRSGICPPVTFLFRREGAEYFQDGHSQKVKLGGSCESLPGPLFHDDRKSLQRWFHSQKRYARLEAQKLLTSRSRALDLPDRIRKLRVISPVAACLYCLIVKRGILDGPAGLLYALQRLTAEALLSYYLLEADLMRLRRPKGLIIECPAEATRNQRQ